MSGFAFSFVAVILAVGVFIYLTVKNYSIIYGSVASAAIVAVFTLGGFTNGLFNLFVGGTMDFLSNMLLVFVSGALFAGLLNDSGCNERLALALVKALGRENVIYVVILLSLIIPMTGASHIIIVAYISFSLMRAAGLPRYVALAAMLGSQFVSQACLPGSLMPGNVIASMLLGTNVYSAPVLGTVSGIIGLICCIIYVKYLIRKCRKNDIGYDPYEGEQIVELDVNKVDHLPNLFVSVLPLIFVIAFTAIAVFCFKLNSTYAVVFASTLGSFLILATCRRTIGRKLKETGSHMGDFITATIMPMLPAIVGTSMVVGLASVIGDTSFYMAVTEWLGNLNMSPYVIVFIGCSVFCLITADSMGGIASFCTVLGPKVLAMEGAVPAVVHRMTTMTATVFETLPHNGGICMALMLFRYTHKEAYKYVAVSTILVPGVMCICGLIMAILGVC